MKSGGLDLKEVDRWTFLFYFEDADEPKLVLKKAPWCFENSLMVIQNVNQVRLFLIFYLSMLQFESKSMICLQICE